MAPDKQDDPAQQLAEWPIYSLADYTNSGSLLDLCRRVLISSDSRHQTVRESVKRRAKDTNLQAILDWKTLVAPASESECIKHSEWAEKLAKLASHLYEAVSSFVTRKSRPAGQPLVSKNSFSSLNGSAPDGLKKQPGEVVSKIVEKAMERRRRRRFMWPRRVASINRTYSLEDVGVKQASKIESKTLLEFWLKQNKKFRSVDDQDLWSKMTLKRGKFGESLVHILLVGQTNEHLILLVLLLHIWPSLVADTFQSLKFDGLGCLHLCIAYHSPTTQLLEFLISIANQLDCIKSLCEQRVTGTLFRSPASLHGLDETRRTSRKKIYWPSRKRVMQDPKADGLMNLYWCDLIHNWPVINGHAHLLFSDRRLVAHGDSSMGNGSKESDQGDELPEYLGDSPLAWSVSLKARLSYETLLANGADPNGQDLDGNGCLHLLVINKQTNWTRFLVRSGANCDLRNHLGFTPFLLSAHLCQSELFHELLELSAVEFWSYSMIRCCGYPLTSLDSIRNQAASESTTRKHSNHSAVLAILESRVSSDERKAQLLSSAVVEKLLEEKWRLYAWRLFYGEFLLTLLHLTLFTLANSLRPDRWEERASLPASNSLRHWWLLDTRTLVSSFM